MTKQEIIERMADKIKQEVCIYEDSHNSHSIDGTDEAAQAAFEVVRDLMPVWRPIESAPRDGTEILLGVDIATVWIVRNGSWNDGEYWEEQEFDSKDELAGWWCYCNSVGQEKLVDIYEPTHWMPLTQPKAEEVICF